MDILFMLKRLYTIEDKDNSGLIKITMGNFDRPVTKYLFVENEGNVSNIIKEILFLQVQI
jgi:hypothetical protein